MCRLDRQSSIQAETGNKIIHVPVIKSEPSIIKWFRVLASCQLIFADILEKTTIVSFTSYLQAIERQNDEAFNFFHTLEEPEQQINLRHQDYVTIEIALGMQ